MEKENKLSDTLKKYQAAQGKSLAEFSSEIGLPKSTTQSIIKSGNASLDTLIRIVCNLDVPLDTLVFGSNPSTPAEQPAEISFFLRSVDCYEKLSHEDQRQFCYHLGEVLKLMSKAAEP